MPELPKPFRAGDPTSASKLNKLIRAIITRMVGGPGINIRIFGNQIVVSLEQTLFSLTHFATQLVIVSNEADYLICNTLDANNVQGTAPINVMKPWTQRRLQFEGKTVNGVTYTFSDNATRLADGTETQKITEDYFVGAIIYAIPINVTYEVLSGVFIDFVDLNVDGRSWSEPE